MQNLKITFNLKLPFIADRFTTIDSILLSEYFSLMRERKKHTTYTDDLSNIDFIDSKGEVLSGSIWYTPKDAPIKLDFTRYYKKPEVRKIFDVTKLAFPEKPITTNFSNSEGKAFALEEEIILTPCVYFYIRGKKGPIEQLLRRIKHFGKKRSIGFGEIDTIEVETIDEDFSYQLNESTPSKPLPIDQFDIKSKKIAFFRRKPPYWEVKDLTACYMPTTALYEHTDSSMKKNNKFSVANDKNYVSGVRFFANKMDGKKGLPKISETKIQEDRKKRWKILEDNSEFYCGATGETAKEGVLNFNNYAAFSASLSSFKNHASFSHLRFVSKEVLWSFKRPVVSISGDSLTTTNGFKKVTISQAEEGERFKDYIKNPFKLKPPFLLLRKTSASKQEHLLLRSRVSLSNAFFSIQFGDKTLYVDGELLLEAVEDMKNILGKDNGITKSHLLGLWGSGKYPELSKKASTDENRLILENFQRKYDKVIRQMLFSVTDFQ